MFDVLCKLLKPGVDFIGAKNWKESPQKKVSIHAVNKRHWPFMRECYSVQENKNRKIDLSVIHVYTERI